MSDTSISESKRLPFFSIIVPVYNIENLISRCIESIVSQSFKDFELIIVDDGSLDTSGAICDRYSEIYPNITVIHKSNGGLVSARKSGILKATGKYICNIDGDDYIANDYLEHFYQLLSNASLDMIAFNYTIVTESDSVGTVSKNLFPSGIVSAEKIYFFREQLLFDNSKKFLNCGALHPSIWSKIVKRDILTGMQLMIPDSFSYGEDLALTSVLCDSCSEILVDDYAGYFYFQRSTSIIHGQNYKKPQDIISVFNFIKRNTKILENNIRLTQIRIFLDLLSSCATRESFDNFQSYFQLFIPCIEEAKKVNFNVCFKDKLKWYLLKNNYKKLYWKMCNIKKHIQ